MKIENVELDEGIRDFIIWLNDNGIKTSACCSGHPNEFRNEGIICFKSVNDCKLFSNILGDIKIFNRIGFGEFSHTSKKALYFRFDRGLDQDEINSLWADLFSRFSFNKFLKGGSIKNGQN